MKAPEMNSRRGQGASWDTGQRMEIKDCSKGTKYFCV